MWKIFIKEFYYIVKMWGDNLIDYWKGLDFFFFI